ncbi:hypothetical protein P3X46_005526 [Hevea brasiliensis]|uniref:GRPD C-terminal domain-containing protein n=1 Tax=Hevea brasiliensis TaxID=3981 RepID=A0ABQ9N080_HEVBR|nr:hypothetical protein P3X46_005526 [Hevea brasiliensis]
MSADISDNMSATARTLSEISEVDTVRLTLDLVSAAKRNVGFLRAVSESQWLHDRATVVEAIRRYDELWMPLMSDLVVVGSTPPMVLPPFDIEWVWFCHTLNPVSYRQYCETRFSKFLGKPAIFDEENEEYALMRCKELWMRRYPNECFENQVDSSLLQSDPVVKNEDLLNEVTKQRLLCSKVSWPYISELVYLIAARQRYKGFMLYVLQRFTDGCSRIVPSLDIFLMWMTHQSYPTVYAEDMKEMEGEILGKIVGMWQTVKEKEVEETKKVWEKAFDQPYEKAGGTIEFHGLAPFKPPVYWEVSNSDVNTKYKSLLPRFLLEVCIFVRLKSRMSIEAVPDDKKHNFLRLRMLRCHRELKIDKPMSGFSLDSWKKASHLYCEFNTKGLMLELHKLGGGCFKTSKIEDTATFLWNDLLRANSLTMERELGKQMRVVLSITPPVQASYLLKCVPDRVTDDSGAMVSDLILRMNHYKPQEGRWLSRTVLDHAGRECFVVRIRVGGGFWRRGGETPSAVKWEDRIIEVREGSWSYVAGSIGKAPGNMLSISHAIDDLNHFFWILHSF